MHQKPLRHFKNALKYEVVKFCNTKRYKSLLYKLRLLLNVNCKILHQHLSYSGDGADLIFCIKFIKKNIYIIFNKKKMPIVPNTRVQLFVSHN